MAPDSIHSQSSTPSRRRPRTPPRGKRDLIGTIGQASWISSWINLVKTILGSGLLAMPLAMAHMGMTLGTLVILWSGLAAGFGLYLQCLCAAYLERGSSSFFALSQITYPNAAVIFDAAIAIKCFGVGVSYLIILGDLMPGVVQAFSGQGEIVPFLLDRHFWITGFMLVVIPLSFLRRLDSLKYTSVVALIGIGYVVVLVVYHCAAKDTIEPHRTPLRLFQWAGIVPTLSSLSVVVFAYTCHQNMFAVLNEIADNSSFQTTSVIGASIGVSAFLYLLTAIAGYLSFGNDVGGNIIKQFAPSVSATVGRLAIVILVVFSYPLQVHPCRASVDAVLKWRPGGILRKSQLQPASGTDSSPPRTIPLLSAIKPRLLEMGETRFAAITTAIIVLSYITAMSVSSLEKVLAWVGAIGSTAISFILPGLFYYKISSPDSPVHQKLLKEEDDFDFDDDPASPRPRLSISNESGRGANGNDTETDGLLSQSGMLGSIKGLNALRLSKQWRRKMLRRLSLALAIYGIVVMVTCLVTNAVFAVN